ncbi:MAG: UDP-N-acetylmuramate dehydrogenase [Candidatus Zixiibacteriota bacterium]
MSQGLKSASAANPGDSEISALLDEFGTGIEQGVCLAPYSSFGAGGPADLFIRIGRPEQLSRLLAAVSRYRIPWVVIGSGTNLLISDHGFRGLVIKNEMRGIERAGNRIKAYAGEDFMALVNAATDASLSGLEFASGIWGAIGGAVVGNAGAYGSEFCDVMLEAELADNQGVIRVEPTEYFEFVYRGSKLKTTREVVVSATVELKPGERARIQARVDEILAIRATKHPKIPNSAGSFFKNIPDPAQPHGKLPAGKLLDEIGAKSMSVGAARVYEKHANILINSGGATSQDIRSLADELKKKAFERHGLTLEEEVVSIGEFD